MPPHAEPRHVDAPARGSARGQGAGGSLAALGVLWALVLLALAALCVRDALVGFTVLGGKPWIATVTRSAAGITANVWAYPIGGACIVVGLVLLLLALKPQTRRGIDLEAQLRVLISKAAVRRLASASARDVEGVDTASAAASRKRVSIEATILSDNEADKTKASIKEVVGARLSGLRTTPTVRVKTTSIGADS